MFSTEQTENNSFMPSSNFLQYLETLPDALFFLDDEQRILYANTTAATELDVSKQDLLGHSFWQCAPHLVSLELYQALIKARHTREPLQMMYCSPVTSLWLHAYLSPASAGIMVFIHKNVGEQNEQMAWDIVEKLAVSVVALTPGGTILYINQAPLEIAHLQKADIIGKQFAETPWWSDAPDSQKHIRMMIKQASEGEIVQFETRIHIGQGRYLERAATLTPHLDTNGHVEYLIYTSSDITARKQAEDELRKLVDTIPQLIWIARPDGYVEYHNQRWLDYTHTAPEHSKGNEWSQSLHPDDRQRVLAVWQRAIQTGSQTEVEQRLRNGATGEYRWFLARGAPYKNAQGGIVKWIGTLTDIDEQKRAEQTLKASEEQLRVLAETVPQFVWTTRADGYLENWNQRYTDYLHVPPEEIQGYGWRQFLHPEEYETTIAARSRSLETGTPYEVEYRLRNGRTGAYRWFLARGAPVRDANGQIVRWFGTCTDIEDQKRIEDTLRQSQERAKELERRKDDFISMASHELRTPLTSLKLQTQLLEKRMAKQENSQVTPVLSRMEGQVKRLERLVEELLDVSKIQAGKLEYHQEMVELHELLSEIIEAMQQMSTTHTIVIHNQVAISLLGDKDRLSQVFTNLISNAIKYSPDASTIEVEMSADTEMVTVGVRDQGIGIPQEQREKIFERFHRAVTPNQKAFPGLGMGLYIVAEIVRQHAGTITVESQLGKGSTFSVRLPLQRDAKQAS